MKRLILFLIYVILLSPVTLSQTTFLDIPITGTKEEMINKLKSKGFQEKECWMEGFYEDNECILILVTENDTVVQLDLINKRWNDNINAKMIFTRLYYGLQSNIYYKEISFAEKNKMYEAVFYQVNSNGIANKNNVLKIKMMHGNGNKYTVGLFFYNK